MSPLQPEPSPQYKKTQFRKPSKNDKIPVTCSLFPQKSILKSQKKIDSSPLRRAESVPININDSIFVKETDPVFVKKQNPISPKENISIPLYPTYSHDRKNYNLKKNPKGPISPPPPPLSFPPIQSDHVGTGESTPSPEISPNSTVEGPYFGISQQEKLKWSQMALRNAHKKKMNERGLNIESENGHRFLFGNRIPGNKSSGLGRTSSDVSSYSTHTDSIFLEEEKTVSKKTPFSSPVCPIWPSAPAKSNKNSNNTRLLTRIEEFSVGENPGDKASGSFLPEKPGLMRSWTVSEQDLKRELTSIKKGCEDKDKSGRLWEENSRTEVWNPGPGGGLQRCQRTTSHNFDINRGNSTIQNSQFWAEELRGETSNTNYPSSSPPPSSPSISFPSPSFSSLSSFTSSSSSPSVWAGDDIHWSSQPNFGGMGLSRTISGDLGDLKHGNDEKVEWWVGQLWGGNLEGRKRAVKRLRVITKERPGNIPRIVDAGGIKPLVAMLRLHDAAILDDVLNVLLKLLSMEDGQNQFVTSGGITALVSVIQMGNIESLRIGETATAVLATMCHIEEAKKQMWMAGAILSFVKILEEASLRAKKDAALALFHLSKEPMFVCDIVRSNGVEVLLELALDPGLSKMIIDILGNLCRTKEGFIAVYESEGSQVLAQLLEGGLVKDRESGVPCLKSDIGKISKEVSVPLRTTSLPATCGTWGLHNESDNSTMLSFGVEDSENIPSLIQSLKGGDVEGKKLALQTLRVLVKNRPKNKLKVIAAGAVEPLVSILQLGTGEMVEHAVTIILNLSLSGEKCRKEVVEVGGIDALVDILDSKNSKICENAAAALFCLSTNKEASTLIRMAGGVRRLVTVLKTASVRGKKDAALALFNLALNPSCAREIAQEGAVKVLLNDALDIMLEEKAVAVLAKLAQVAEGRMDIYNEGGIPILVDVLEGASKRSVEDAACCLLSLAANIPEALDAMLSEGVMLPLVSISMGASRARIGAKALIQLLRSRRQRTPEREY